MKDTQKPSSIYSCSIDPILEHEFCHLGCWAIKRKFLKRRNFCLIKYATFWGGFFNFLWTKKELNIFENILASALKHYIACRQRKYLKSLESNLYYVQLICSLTLLYVHLNISDYLAYFGQFQQPFVLSWNIGLYNDKLYISSGFWKLQFEHHYGL